MDLERIRGILESCETESPLIPPTMLFNEGWLLRLILDWFSKHSVEDHALNFSINAHWFSEALLPSAFLARYKGDRLAESWTHADGVVGHFLLGNKSKAGLSLLPRTTHLVVLEAKMFSRLSPGVKNASYFDQAARNTACIAELFHRANLPPQSTSRIGFYVLAPLAQIKRGVFDKAMNRDSIQQNVKRRVKEFQEDRDLWYSNWFQPTFQEMEVGIISWEEIIDSIRKIESTTAEFIDTFYERCVAFNK